MKKEDIASYVIYLLMVTLALILGFTLIKETFQNIYDSSAYGNQFLFAFLTIVVGVLLNAFGLELGHLIGGALGGYSIVSFNVLGFCIYKKEGKTKFGFKNFDGLTGETVLAPKKEKANPKHFVWIPLVLYLIELFGCIILYYIGDKNRSVANSPFRFFATVAVLWIAISSMIALYNFVPLKLDSMTDGYRLTLISKKINVEAYNELMRIENLQREGKEVDKIRVFEEVTDFTASINLMTVYEYLSHKKYDEALKIIDMMCENKEKISHETFNKLMAQKLYIMILTLPLEDAKKYYDEQIDDKIRRFISSDTSMESLRAYVLIAGLLDESLGEVQYANSRKRKALKLALTSRAKIEEELYDDAINKVIEIHPEWKEELASSQESK